MSPIVKDEAYWTAVRRAATPSEAASAELREKLGRIFWGGHK